MVRKAVRPSSPSEYSSVVGSYSTDSTATDFPRNPLIDDETSTPESPLPQADHGSTINECETFEDFERLFDPLASTRNQPSPRPAATAVPAPSISRPSRTLQPIDDHLNKYLFAVGNGRVRKLEKKKFKKITFNCKPCGKQFTSRSQLVFHQNSKSHEKGIRAYQVKNIGVRCSPCNRSFQCHNDLDIHLKSNKHRRTIAYLRLH